MTDRQCQIARHMLGLGNAKRSYRNRFFAGEGHHDYPTLVEMESAGLVVRRAPLRVGSDMWLRDDAWHLTRAAAESVLLPGETLDPEDFPA